MAHSFVRSVQEDKTCPHRKEGQTNEGKINSQSAILQSRLLLCDVLTGGSPPADLDPSQGDQAWPAHISLP